jgi:NADPH:quinone reductase-like Zn-dependent oxidoreductase
MKAYHIDRFGGVGGIVRRSSEDPRPGPKEVLMRVRASSLNYRDLMVLTGGGRGPTKIGVVPLSDGAGEVAAIGKGATRVKIGDRIAGCFHPRWFGGPIKLDYLTDRLGANLDGVLAEYAVFNEEAVVFLPSHLSFEEAATLPCAAVTAWVALTGHRRVTAGETVLIQGSGGVNSRDRRRRIESATSSRRNGRNTPRPRCSRSAATTMSRRSAAITVCLIPSALR